ncbi:MAG TPA: acetate--CoA ligase family protein [Anaerolineales bacterium]
MTDRCQRLPFRPLFAPRSVAVVGASTRPDTVGRAVFSNILLHGFTGVVYPVNPKTGSILGVKAYPSVLEIPDAVELAVIVVPSGSIPQVLEECGRKGITAAVIISAGFREIGAEGAKREEVVVETARRFGIALIGPNCLGIINTDPQVQLNASFARTIPLPGNIALISQSGAVGVAALEYARAERIGLSKFASVGNKADINENDLLAFLGADPLTDVILLYLEDLSDPTGFVQLAQEISRQKPILAVKSGRTVEGARAASSHTGALAGSDEAYDSLFAQCGVLRVESLEELFEFAEAFAMQPLPQGNRVAIVTNAGGPGIMATDASVRQGLALAPLADATRATLREKLPPAAPIDNPVDVLGDAGADRYAVALEAVLADPAVDGVILVCTPQLMTDLKAIAATAAAIAPRHRKPTLLCLMATGNVMEDVLAIVTAARLPHYQFPEDAARALAAMARYARGVHRPRAPVKTFSDVDREAVARILARVRQENRHFLPEPEAYAVLQAYRFPVLPFHWARDEADAVQAAEAIGYPVVVKIVSPDILHKIDVGGVRLNLANSEAVRRAYGEMMAAVRGARPEARIDGVLVQKMVRGGKETILGMKRDPHFGPLLLFGLGGTYVEIFRDVAVRIAPITASDALQMFQELRSLPILSGYRGEPPADIDAITECLQRLSQLALDFPVVHELDMNPLVVFEKGKGAGVIDARIFISDDRRPMTDDRQPVVEVRQPTTEPTGG